MELTSTETNNHLRRSISSTGADSVVDEDDDELQLQWAAIERLPTFKRLRTSLFDGNVECGSSTKESEGKRVTDVTKLGAIERKVFIEKLIRHIENDNQRLLQKLRERIDRLTLLLGPPGCGKTTFLLALAGRLDQSFKVYKTVINTAPTMSRAIISTKRSSEPQGTEDCNSISHLDNESNLASIPKPIGNTKTASDCMSRPLPELGLNWSCLDIRVKFKLSSSLPLLPLLFFFFLVQLNSLSLTFLSPPCHSTNQFGNELGRQQLIPQHCTTLFHTLQAIRITQAHMIAHTGRMVLPFEPLTVAFSDVQYFVDTPLEMKRRGFNQKKLQLLHDITGTFRSGILTALMGVSGAGKTTFMDVLSGRKTGGTIKGDIRIGGYPKVQKTFARISAYCEQTDIHSPQITVEESVKFSAWLRLPPETPCAQGISAIPKIKDNYNPATWMLEVTSPSVEAELGIDFANIYKESHPK